ncbi:MAG: hypothetical protein ACRDY0_13435 [Acidimicrobiales bacterium]
MPDADLPPELAAPAPAADDTAAFQRFYRGSPASPDRGLAYRILVGWWRDRPSPRR